MTQHDEVYRFNRAIVRRPARSVVSGLRAEDTGDPTYEGVMAEHDAYITALRANNVDVTILPALEAFPDAVFIEDPALVFTQGSVILRSCAASRAGEAQAIKQALQESFNTVLNLPTGGFVEGGDVLVTPRSVMIGLSARTDRQGAEGLVKQLAALGQTGQIVQTPPDVLHFKTDCALLDEETILTTARLARSGVFDGFRTVLVPDGEEAAANALRVNDMVFIGSDFPKTIALLAENNFDVLTMPTSQIGKIDAGLSCMSLRWQQ